MSDVTDNERKVKAVVEASILGMDNPFPEPEASHSFQVLQNCTTRKSS